MMVGTELAEKQAVDTREQIVVGRKKTNESWFLGSISFIGGMNGGGMTRFTIHYSELTIITLAK